MSRPPKKDTLMAMLAMQSTLQSLRQAQLDKLQLAAQEQEQELKPTESRDTLAQLEVIET